jgi:hypothetical protein
MEIIATVKSDAIIIDWFIHCPSLTESDEVLRLVVVVLYPYC